MDKIELKISDLPVPYPEAVAAMDARVAAIHDGTAPEMLWLLQHPPLYTAGTSARTEDLVEPDRLPVFDSGARRPIYLSWARAADRLSDARPETPGATICAVSSAIWKHG